MNFVLSSFVLSILSMMGAVAFFTLLERKYLGYFQLRVGPNKVGLKGVAQPIADAMKLFLKEYLVPDMVNKFLFVFGPCLMLIVCISAWVLYPVKFPSVYYLWGFLFFVCVSSAGIYGIIMVGWSSNSKYAYLGCVRAVAQFISYEVSAVMILLCVVVGAMSFSFTGIEKVGLGSLGMFFPLFLMWLVCLLAETNRAPFDFVEGESELVSGFNVEYSGVGFAMIFIAEYSMILFMSVITTSVFFGGIMFCGIFLSGLVSFFIGSFVILSRGALPRYRYDLLMGLTWKYFLPVVVAYLGMVIVLV